MGEGKRAPVLTKGSMQGIVCKRHKTGVELGGFGRGAEAGVRWWWGPRRDFGGGGGQGGTLALHAHGGFEEGLRALRWRQGLLLPECL